MSQFEQVSKELLAYIQNKTISTTESIQTLTSTVDNLGTNVVTNDVTSQSISNSGPLSTSGNLSVNGNKFIVDATSGNTTIVLGLLWVLD